MAKKKVVEFLKSLIIKAGANPEDEAIKAALNELGADLEISEELITPIDNGLLSLSTAKNNHPEVKKHYFGQAYSGLDAELEALMQAEKLPDDVVAEIKQETSSTKRAAKLAVKIKELEAKKAGANKGDTQKLNEQIADLNNQLRAAKEATADAEKKHISAIKDVKKSYALNQLLAGYKTIHDGLDPETKNIILSAVINKNLNAKKANWDVDDNNNLLLLGEGNTNLFGDDNRQLTPKTFLDQVLANEKMLVVNDSNSDNNTNQNQNSNRPNNGQYYNNNGRNGNTNNNNGSQNNNNGNRKPNPVLLELIENSKKDIQAGTSNNGS
jgi:hypothetical protein